MRHPAPYATPTHVTLMMMRNGADAELIATYMDEELRAGGFASFAELLTPEERFWFELATSFEKVRESFSALAKRNEQLLKATLNQKRGHQLTFTIFDETEAYRER